MDWFLRWPSYIQEGVRSKEMSISTVRPLSGEGLVFALLDCRTVIGCVPIQCIDAILVRNRDL